VVDVEQLEPVDAGLLELLEILGEISSPASI
jgi:hypothetical protein